jgi:methionine biosynthesis protein MetW
MNKNDFYDKGYCYGASNETRIKRVLKIIKGVSGKQLLDIGCGDGFFTILLKDSIGAEEVVGIEIASEGIKALEAKGIKAYKLDIDEDIFPFQDSYFDVVNCSEIIEHLFNPDHMLQEIYRVLKPGGICIITTPNLAGWPSRLALLLGYQPYPTAVSPTHESAGKLFIKGYEGQWGHIRVFTLKALKELINLYQFKIIGVKGCPITLSSKKSAVISFIDKIFSYIPSLATRVIIIIKV